jgi:hypothetical protein
MSVSVEGFVLHEVTNHVEHRAVVNQKARLDRLVADGLNQKGFSHAWWSQPQDILGFADEPACRQVIDLSLVDGWIESEVEWSAFSGRGTPRPWYVVGSDGRPHGHFILKDQLKNSAWSADF